ncbi:MAG: hypothetical protein JW883_05270 [Deltaproteobacteria bacterium]|nr:hypothetical protein [Deltaproteobacteria bacterium]
MGFWAAALPVLKQIGMAVATDQAKKLTEGLGEKMLGGLKGGAGSNTGTKTIIPLHTSSNRQPSGGMDPLLEMQFRREIMKKELEDLERRRRLADWTRRIYASMGMSMS